MRLSIFAAAAVALLAGSAVSAEACNVNAALHSGKAAVSPVLPAALFAKNNNSAPVTTSIVGFWRLAYTDGNGHVLFPSLQQWHSDGTEFEFADIPTITGDICMGTWTSSGRKYNLWHTAWTFDTNGNPNGTMVLVVKDELTTNGLGFNGTFDLKFLDNSGGLKQEITGKTHGERLTVPQ
ncbi:MAG TPA: hypothetical protein VGG10_05310 [Rhizomicrobium sp.]|jgi:hypothetical protein